MPAEIPDQISGVEDEEIKAALGVLSALPTMDASDHERFVVEIRALAESRAQAGWLAESSADMAVFVLTEYPREGEKYGGKRVADLGGTEHPLLGSLFLLNRDASAGYALPIPATEPGEVIHWLCKNGFNSSVVFVYRKKHLLIARPHPDAIVSHKEAIRDSPPAATLEEIGKALNHVYSEWLITPTVCPAGVWEAERSSEYVPGPRPEKTIQRQVAITLSSWFHGVVRANMEETVRMGRIDVRLLRQNSDGLWLYWAIIELKIVRSFHNACKPKKPKNVTHKANAEAVAEGIRQAYHFAKDNNAVPLLEIYDQRQNKGRDVLKEETVLKALAKCKTIKPSCRVWPLFGESSDARMQVD